MYPYYHSSNGHDFYGTSPYLHRSSSTLSLDQHHPQLDQTQSLFEQKHHHQQQQHEIYDLDGGGYMRRVLSTGDILEPYGSSHEYSGNTAILEAITPASSSSIGKVGRYSAEERKGRIERYRNKRNHRNFQKKITYACRKTLADSRPRVRGRFARNGDAEVEVGEESNGNRWCGWLETTEVMGINGTTTAEIAAAAASGGVGGDDQYCHVDDEIWATFLSDFSISNFIC